MPKFMTYQRPMPVNKANWSGKPGSNPFQPIRKAGGPFHPGPELKSPMLHGPTNGDKRH